MYQPVVLYIALRYIRRKTSERCSRLISWLSTSAIMLGVIALVTVLSVMNGFEHEIKKNILKFTPQAVLTLPEGRLDPKQIPASIFNHLLGITCITPITTCDVIIQSANNLAIGVMLGISPKDTEPLSSYFLEAKKDDLVSGQYQVILGSELANILRVKRGNLIRIIVPSVSQFTLMGQIPSQRLFTIVGTFQTNNEVDRYQLIVNQQDAAKLMRYPIGYITGWRLWFQQPLSLENISNQSLPNSLVWHDWREKKGELFQAIRMEKKMMVLLLSLIVTVAAFNIISSLSLLVIEKTKEVAILQTQGLTPKQVMLIFIAQGASAGIFGSLLGIFFGLLLASQVKNIMPVIRIIIDEATLPVVIEPMQIAIIAILTIAVSLISTIYPSWRAASINPSQALRNE